MTQFLGFCQSPLYIGLPVYKKMLICVWPILSMTFQGLGHDIKETYLLCKIILF